MKKYLLSGIILGGFAAYLTLLNKDKSNPVNTQPEIPASTDIIKTTKNQQLTDKPGLYLDGQYLGSKENAYWGNIQVKAIVEDEHLVDIEFVEYPNDRQNSIAINESALTQLKSEAIEAQSAEVSIITGATDTSVAFIKSLYYALEDAKK